MIVPICFEESRCDGESGILGCVGQEDPGALLNIAAIVKPYVIDVAEILCRFKSQAQLLVKFATDGFFGGFARFQSPARRAVKKALITISYFGEQELVAFRAEPAE